MKTAKVVSVEFTQSFEYNNEMYYQHKYLLNDGTELLANHKKMNPIAAGTDVEFEVKGNDKNGMPKGTVKELRANTNFGGGSKYEKDTVSILYQTCLKIAGDMFSRYPSNIEVQPIQVKNFAGELCRMAKADIEAIKENK